MNDIALQNPAMHFSLITPTPGYEREVARDWIRNAYADLSGPDRATVDSVLAGTGIEALLRR